MRHSRPRSEFDSAYLIAVLCAPPPKGPPKGEPVPLKDLWEVLTCWWDNPVNYNEAYFNMLIRRLIREEWLIDHGDSRVSFNHERETQQCP